MQRHATPEAALSAVYGFPNFRGVQARAIAAALEGRDAVVVMATGGGKSLCYLLPPLVLGRAVVVVSPLCSLMQDQVMALEARGLSACYLGSAQADPGVRQRVGTYQYVYVTPELAITERFLDELRNLIQPCLIAIDEAHCVSEFGHEFRPEYRGLASLRAACPGVPMMAVTATATPATRRDIRANLGLGAEAVELVTSLDRPNLACAVRTTKSEARLVAELRDAVDAGVAIVYTMTTKEADALAVKLATALRCDVRAYHAKLATTTRAEIHAAFARESARVVVATIAFGMGVDMPHVRLQGLTQYSPLSKCPLLTVVCALCVCVVCVCVQIRLVALWGPPKTVESLYQMWGRAGRDGEPARCVLFAEPSDFPRLQGILTTNADEAGKARALAGLRAVQAMCGAALCRRKALAAHFGEHDVAACGACDVCVAPAATATPSDDVSAPARAFLAGVGALEGRFGVTTVFGVVRGAPPAKHAARFEALPCLGAAREASEATLKRVADACRAHGLIVDAPRASTGGFRYVAPELTEAGRAWLDDAAATLRAPRGAKRDRGGVDAALLARLKAVRKSVAVGLPAYIVCSNETLAEMARRRPTTREALRGVSGIGEAKLQKYGDAFLAVFR
jgi:ATP-dependent DNA helicase RecQ